MNLYQQFTHNAIRNWAPTESDGPWKSSGVAAKWQPVAKLVMDVVVASAALLVLLPSVCARGHPNQGRQQWASVLHAGALGQGQESNPDF